MNLKKIIIIVAILIIILFITLLILGWYEKHQEEYGATPPTEDIPIVTEAKLSKVSVVDEFYSVKDIVNKFYSYLKKTQAEDYKIIDEEVEQALEEEENSKAEAIYNMLDERYIQYKGIDKSNIFDKIQQEEYVDVYINEMLVSEKNTQMYVYIVYGTLHNNETNSNKNFSLLIEVDRGNRTFSIFLEDYIKEKVKIEEAKELEFEIDDYIENKGDNTYTYRHITEEEYALGIFDTYKTNMMYNLEHAYELLDENYKKIKFPTMQDFEEYRNKKYTYIVGTKIEQYQVNEFSEYKQYILVDQHRKTICV